MGNLPTPEPEEQLKEHTTTSTFDKLDTSKTPAELPTSSTAILHIVYFRFYTHIPPSIRTKIGQEFMSLQHRCLHYNTRKPYIRSFTGGSDVSIENLQRGFHAAFILEFASEADRDFYVKEDEVHSGFGVQRLTGIVEDVMVVDFRKGEF